MTKSVLIDGNNLLHRCYWIANNRSRNVSTYYLYLQSIKKYKNQFNPDEIFVFWDTKLQYETKNFRKQLAEDKYKAGRDHERNVEVFKHEEGIKLLNKSLGVIDVNPGVLEADDIFYWFCQEYPDKEKIIITVDKDMLQLIDENTTVYSPIADKIITYRTFEDDTGVKVQDFVPYKAIIGDKSDNLPGLPRVGHKTAIKMLSTPNFYDNLSEDNKKIYDFNKKMMDLAEGPKEHPGESDILREQVTNNKDLQPNSGMFFSLAEKYNMKAIETQKSAWDIFFMTNDVVNLIKKLSITHK